MFPTRVFRMQPSRAFYSPAPVSPLLPPDRVWSAIIWFGSVKANSPTEGGSQRYDYPLDTTTLQAIESPGLKSSGKREGARELTRFPAHTISQRLRLLRKVPPELIPLGMSSTMKLRIIKSKSNHYMFLGIVLGYVSI